ncbi:MAG: hypothetical protein EB830_03535 [Nitrosopumilus sp. H13]|nr:MAG: hypothetical protein EB830_03535 [Nitrosopumilus sp. H13]
MNYSLYLTLFAVAAVGFLVPAYAQLADHVVINEVETNPPGNDAKSISEWVELYNPTDSAVDLKGWVIAPTGSKKTLELPAGTILDPGQTAIFSYGPLWFNDLGESLELRSANGTIIDKTPSLTDQKNSLKSWQRLYDGYAPNSIDDWKFATFNAGSSNGKLIESQEVDPVSIHVSVERPSYLFGETAIIRGNVSEKIFTVKPTFQPTPIVISITGTGFEKKITLYPDTNLSFEASQSLHQVLGIGGGNYDVSVTYSDATASSGFSVGEKLSKPEAVKETVVTITTDQPSYLPSQIVRMTATTNKIIPSAVLQFEIIDPDGKVIESGNLFSTDGKFTTRIFLNPVSPVYGTHEIKATFATKSATATFEVSEKPLNLGTSILLATNQTVYGLGETVHVTGKINGEQTNPLKLLVERAKLPDADTFGDFQINIIVPVDDDGSFAYVFDLPRDKNSLGYYLIRASETMGSEEIIIHSVEDPATFARSTDPITIMLDDTSYTFGQSITIDGHVLDPVDRTTVLVAPVSISISKEGGAPLRIANLGPQDGKNLDALKTYDVATVPELTGLYKMQLDIVKNIFEAGKYVITAKHSDHAASAEFTVYDLPDLKESSVTIDKDVYGLGETVMLEGILSTDPQTISYITLTKPDGSVAKFDVPINNRYFSWSWNIPDAEQTPSAIVGSSGDSFTPTLGIYKLSAAFGSADVHLRFKVSSDPANDVLSTGLIVSTDKPFYKTTDRLLVTGNVNPSKSFRDGSTEMVTISVYQIYPYDPIQVLTSSVFPERDGSFSNTIDLPPSLFADGSYGVSANYLGDRAVSAFVVGFEDDSFLVSTDSAEYLPDSSVIITGTGGPDSGRLDISVIRESDSNVICGTSICGSILGTKKSISLQSGSFEYTLDLPDSAPFGKYEVMVASGTLIKPAMFDVVEELTIVETAKPRTVIEKENRITDRNIVITTEEKTTDDGSISPRVVSGSMIVNRGDEADVNLMISTESGTCVIGPGDGCLVSESTRKPGKIYDTVEVDGMSLNVRYSGPDVRLEKFSIIPESADEFLPDMDWHVSMVKDEQISRFYYKVTYKTIP